MRNRIIDLSEVAVGLRVRNDLLVVRVDDEREVTVPLEEIAVVIAAHPAIHLTQAVLARLAEHGAVFMSCDRSRLPIAMLMPLQSHHVQTERMRKQVEASLPTRKRLWQQIIRAKIRAQGELVMALHGDDPGLIPLVPLVRSGDPANVEARASRLYWRRLFLQEGFRRDRDAGDANRFLNYGYAVLRGIVARSVCGAGLHPSFGLHHSNRYNPFTLADDLMEPFRPLVDRAVVDLVTELGADAPMDKDSKAFLLEGLQMRLDIGGEMRGLFDVTARVAKSLNDVFAGERKDLELPKIEFEFVRS